MGLLWSKKHQFENETENKEKIVTQNRKIQSQPLFTYGNTMFSLSEKDIHQIEKINENNFEIFFQHDWSLEYRQFQIGNWSQVFKRMVSTDVQILALFMSGSNQIIKEIEHIKFTNLSILSLGCNKIFSIEGLAFLDIDTLKALRINENLITSIQPLEKLKCNNLEILLLAENNIVRFDKMNRIKFNSVGSRAEFKSKLSIDLRLKEQQKAFTNQMRVDIGFFMKIQLYSLNQLRGDYALIRPEHLSCLKIKNGTQMNII